ncbi:MULTISPECIES: DUF6488 family protein [Alteromonadales]|jgi:hypothetical protein|uniref:DUF6488 family protein n=2 Tax=Gammaproteobacteria TaxID=1236 RepID=UPI000F4E53A1|nr:MULTISPECIES: DUF6488 family protein [Alteromonadales]RPA30791.1 hypothetical protein EGC78_14255 [Shewanella frigidimarina]UJL44148.1 hypothetical protein KDH10_001588 [Shewanella vesiculosa]|tara:strand:- start:1142 stop:1501 length:360 start_codon:yes stop_codon:yes gene_type:complete
MRNLFIFLVIGSAFIGSYSFAHVDRMKSMDHSRNSHMNEKKVISITIKTINKMTFKDLGYEAGKLPSSWETINNADVNIVNVHEGSYVVSATNSQVKQTLYFRIDDDGDVVAVSENKGF